tara:strand:+ start:57153 stop:57791 length:639 start_codon:yes stop_codon:yes gene_type:complete
MAQLTAMDFRSSTLSPTARALALLIVISAAVSLSFEFMATQLDHPTDSALQILWRLARYFTILTNLLVLISFFAIVSLRRKLGALWMGGLAVWITVTGAVYHLLLASVHQGLSLYADFGLHTLTPVLTMLWWLIFAPKGNLGLGPAILWLFWPALYILYALWRGTRDGDYPYFFIDPAQVGWDGVAIWSAMLGLGFLALGLVYSWIGRIARR